MIATPARPGDFSTGMPETSATRSHCQRLVRIARTTGSRSSFETCGAGRRRRSDLLTTPRAFNVAVACGHLPSVAKLRHLGRGLRARSGRVTGLVRLSFELGLAPCTERRTIPHGPRRSAADTIWLVVSMNKAMRRFRRNGAGQRQCRAFRRCGGVGRTTARNEGTIDDGRRWRAPRWRENRPVAGVAQLFQRESPINGCR